MVKDTVVHLPENYKEILIKRKELSKFVEKIIWYEDEEELFKSIEYLVIAVPPESQFLILKNNFNYKNIKNYLLEKPPAKDPLEAKYLVELMKSQTLFFNLIFFLNCQ